MSLQGGPGDNTHDEYYEGHTRVIPSPGPEYNARIESIRQWTAVHTAWSLKEDDTKGANQKHVLVHDNEKDFIDEIPVSGDFLPFMTAAVKTKVKKLNYEYHNKVGAALSSNDPRSRAEIETDVRKTFAERQTAERQRRPPGIKRAASAEPSNNSNTPKKSRPNPTTSKNTIKSPTIVTSSAPINTSTSSTSPAVPSSNTGLLPVPNPTTAPLSLPISRKQIHHPTTKQLPSMEVSVSSIVTTATTGPPLFDIRHPREPGSPIRSNGRMILPERHKLLASSMGDYWVTLSTPNFPASTEFVLGPRDYEARVVAKHWANSKVTTALLLLDQFGLTLAPKEDTILEWAVAPDLVSTLRPLSEREYLIDPPSRWAQYRLTVRGLVVSHPKPIPRRTAQERCYVLYEEEWTNDYAHMKHLYQQLLLNAVTLKPFRTTLEGHTALRQIAVIKEQCYPVYVVLTDTILAVTHTYTCFMLTGVRNELSALDQKTIWENFNILVRGSGSFESVRPQASRSLPPAHVPRVSSSPMFTDFDAGSYDIPQEDPESIQVVAPVVHHAQTHDVRGRVMRPIHTALSCDMFPGAHQPYNNVYLLLDKNPFKDPDSTPRWTGAFGPTYIHTYAYGKADADLLHIPTVKYIEYWNVQAVHSPLACLYALNAMQVPVEICGVTHHAQSPSPMETYCAHAHNKMPISDPIEKRWMYEGLEDFGMFNQFSMYELNKRLWWIRAQPPRQSDSWVHHMLTSKEKEQKSDLRKFENDIVPADQRWTYTELHESGIILGSKDSHRPPLKVTIFSYLPADCPSSCRYQSNHWGIGLIKHCAGDRGYVYVQPIRNILYFLNNLEPDPPEDKLAPSTIYRPLHDPHCKPKIRAILTKGLTDDFKIAVEQIKREMSHGIPLIRHNTQRTYPFRQDTPICHHEINKPQPP